MADIETIAVQRYRVSTARHISILRLRWQLLDAQRTVHTRIRQAT
jgi:hypothetical protein